MKSFFTVLLGLCGALTLAGQAPSSAGMPLRTPEELDDLFAPIALYPDALVALILPAATVSSDLANAAAYLSANGDPAQINNQPWDASVKSLAHYPEVVKWMNENSAWTQQAGQAFLAQPADVMKSIQQLRARAVAAGSLKNTPQQQVVMDGDAIRIIPAQPDEIYVPTYDPNLVYEEQPGYDGPWLTFGMGYPEGVWLNYDLDWDTFGIWVGQWHRGWDYRHPAWRVGPRGGAVGRPWRPGPGRMAYGFDLNRSRESVVHPTSFSRAPGRPPQVRPRSPAPDFRRNTPNPAGRPDLRGYPPGSAGRAPVLTRPVPSPSSAFGGYDRGSDVRAASQRGQVSRQEVRAPAEHASPPSSRGNSSGSGRR